MFLLNEAAGFETIHSRHGHVEHDNVRLQTLNLLDGFDPVRCFAYYFPIASTLK